MRGQKEVTRLLLALLLLGVVGCEQKVDPPAITPHIIKKGETSIYERMGNMSWLCHVDESKPTDTFLFEKDGTIGTTFQARCTRYERKTNETIPIR